MGLMKILQQADDNWPPPRLCSDDTQASMIHRSQSNTDFMPMGSSSSPSEVSGTSTEELYRPKTFAELSFYVERGENPLTHSFNAGTNTLGRDGPSRHLFRSVSEKAGVTLPLRGPPAVEKRTYLSGPPPRRSVSSVPAIKRPIFDSIGPELGSENGLCNSNSNVSDVMQKESRRRFFTKTRSKKSLGLPVPVPILSGWDLHRDTWISPESCVWQNLSMGQTLRLEPSCTTFLSEKEYSTLQKLRLSKLQALQLGINVTIPKGDSKKSKRFGMKKARSNTVSIGNLFEHLRDVGRRDRSVNDSCSPRTQGWVFSFPLDKVLFNDQLLRRRRMQPPAPGSASSSGLVGAESSCEDYVKLVTESGEDLLSVGKENSSTSSEDNRSMDSSAAAADLLADTVSTSSSAGAVSGSLTAEEKMYSPHHPRVPHIFTVCTAFLEEHGTSSEGLFRVGGSKKRIKQLREEFDSGRGVEFGSFTSVHDVAGLLKEFFREIPAPLLTKGLYSGFLETAKVTDSGLRLLAIKYLVSLLPVPNRDLLKALLCFLFNISQHSNDSCSPRGDLIPGNKMDARNLAIVFGPNILHNLRGSAAGEEFAVDKPEKAVRTRDIIEIMQAMILNGKEIFEISASEQDEILRTMMDVSQEDTSRVLAYRLNTPSSPFSSSMGSVRAHLSPTDTPRRTYTSPQLDSVSSTGAATVDSDERFYRSRSSPYFGGLLTRNESTRSNESSVSAAGSVCRRNSERAVDRISLSSRCSMPAVASLAVQEKNAGGSSEENLSDGEDYGNYVELREPPTAGSTGNSARGPSTPNDGRSAFFLTSSDSSNFDSSAQASPGSELENSHPRSLLGMADNSSFSIIESSHSNTTISGTGTSARVIAAEPSFAPRAMISEPGPTEANAGATEGHARTGSSSSSTGLERSASLCARPPPLPEKINLWPRVPLSPRSVRPAHKVDRYLGRQTSTEGPARVSPPPPLLPARPNPASSAYYRKEPLRPQQPLTTGRTTPESSVCGTGPLRATRGTLTRGITLTAAVKPTGGTLKRGTAPLPPPLYHCSSSSRGRSMSLQRRGSAPSRTITEISTASAAPSWMDRSKPHYPLGMSGAVDSLRATYDRDGSATVGRVRTIAKRVQTTDSTPVVDQGPPLAPRVGCPIVVEQGTSVEPRAVGPPLPQRPPASGPKKRQETLV